MIRSSPSAPAARLRTAFLAHLQVCRRAEVAALDARIDAALDEAWQKARAAWPGVEVSERAFFDYLGQRLPAQGDALSALAQLHAADLYLACACAAGDAVALRRFEASCVSQIDAVLARRGHAPDVIDEVKQIVRARLLVGGARDRTSKIAEYSGRGALVGWLRAIAVRTALNLVRAEKRSAAGRDELLLDLTDGQHPELSYLKDRYQEAFAAAFRGALASLEPRDRLLLRQHTLDGLTADQIGALYGIHRVSAFRWLARARDRLQAATRRHLIESLRIAPAELESILRLIESRIDISLGLASRSTATTNRC
jgi:RNA polymerase sigma-70 factor (ECF subfamily)